MRIYVNPTQWYWEPSMDPFKEEELIEQYGENWREHVEFEYFAEEDEEFLSI